jgi:hypothetical protein
VAGAIHKATTGRFFFFTQTTTEEKVSDIRKVIPVPTMAKGS